MNYCYRLLRKRCTSRNLILWLVSVASVVDTATSRHHRSRRRVLAFRKTIVTTTRALDEVIEAAMGIALVVVDGTKTETEDGEESTRTGAVLVIIPSLVLVKRLFCREDNSNWQNRPSAEEIAKQKKLLWGGKSAQRTSTEVFSTVRCSRSCYVGFLSREPAKVRNRTLQKPQRLPLPFPRTSGCGRVQSRPAALLVNKQTNS